MLVFVFMHTVSGTSFEGLHIIFLAITDLQQVQQKLINISLSICRLKVPLFKE